MAFTDRAIGPRSGAQPLEADGTGTSELEQAGATAYAMGRTMRAMREMFAQLAGTDAEVVELPAFLVLSHLELEGSTRSGRLAESLCVDQSTISRQLSALQQLDWVRREPDPGDGRARQLRLTEAGRNALQGNRLARARLLSAAIADWTPQQRSQLLSSLQHLQTAIISHTRGLTPPKATQEEP